MSHSPFGRTICSDDIVESLSFFDTWEDRYKYVIELGRELPPLSQNLKNDAHLVRGCQSQVWIDYKVVRDALWFEADSDAFIVKGLLAVVLAAYNGKTPKAILKFDIESYFAQIGLLKHLSVTRGNGLKSMVKRIQAIAKQISESSTE